MVNKGLPLEDITVIDAAQLVAGAYGPMLMSDFGADVIKIEHPEYGDAIRNWGEHEEHLSWKWIGRNKKSVALDLKAEAGQEIFKNLVEDADVLFESFRPGTLEEWGLGWETLSDVNPGLIMVRVSGFGQTGPYSERPGFGTLAEAMSGFAYITGQESGPPTLPSIPLSDSISALQSSFAAMFALYWRDMYDGEGQYIDSSLFEPLFGIMGDQAVRYSAKGDVQERHGNRAPHSAPRNTYETKDGKYVAIAAATDSTAFPILRLVGGGEAANDPRFESPQKRVQNVDEIDDMIQSWMNERTREEVIEIFEDHGITGVPVYNIADIVQDEHFLERDAVVDVNDDELGNIKMSGVFPKMSETPGRIKHSGVPLGTHTEEVLKNRLSIDEETIDELAERDVINRGV